MPNLKQIVIVHGTMGSPEGNWFPWLKKELAALGQNVIVPAFPTPENQSYEIWKETFLKKHTAAPEDTILVGHSIGAPFVLRLAEETAAPFHAVFSVCPFVDFLGNKEFDELNKTFVDHIFDWEKVKQGSKKHICFMGDNDPYVPKALAKKVSDSLNAETFIIEGGGHLNAEFDYLAFPALLDEIKKVL